MLRHLAIVMFLLLPACAQISGQRKAEPTAELPVTRWDFRPESEIWTQATLQALTEHGAALPAMVPADYAEWCPEYAAQTPENRAAFWTGLLSALAKHESTWRPDAVGGGGLWYGLTQIDPRTARAYNCDVTSGQALKDGAANLRCAVRIAAVQVAKRGTINRGMRDWGPFHSAAKRAEMAAWTRSQPYCQAPEPKDPFTNLLDRL
ncbi:lytic transglycosylase domain-containing protein [Palleronia pelagia]|uniref:Transglycosylase SLT domain-containing protein n=1 Tax=Palleronia pelagia TaxID=387096 RepID=A0A1H8K213_9RHOB|nr:transglycosylase SLT domain-containing protein [Palleronia pelagia]SEN87010.1 Transglycosylase SLT domain-containing protein [Palleronia pelagia]